MSSRPYILQKQVLFVPQWVYANLQRQGKSASVLFESAEFLPKYLSSSDLASIRVLNNHVGDLLVLPSRDVYWETYSLSGLITTKTRDSYTWHNTAETLSRDESFKASVMQRLMDEDTYTQHETPFNIYDINRNSAVVVLNPGHFVSKGHKQYKESSELSLAIALVEAVLKTLYMYYSVSEVSSHSWFSNYVKLLAKRG